jgi:hypothetical protein
MSLRSGLLWITLNLALIIQCLSRRCFHVPQRSAYLRLKTPIYRRQVYTSIPRHFSIHHLTHTAILSVTTAPEHFPVQRCGPTILTVALRNGAQKIPECVLCFGPSKIHKRICWPSFSVFSCLCATPCMY